MSDSTETREPPPGKLVDIGGYRLHINCMGKESPTVILEAGLACDSGSWLTVPSEIAKVARVCSYDRAGLGWSDPGPKPRTSQQMVNELHTLLAKAEIQSPYVLVGHSFGGYHIRLYASHYPDEVVGMVLVDANHHDQEKHMSFDPVEAAEANRNAEGVRIPEDFFESANQVRRAAPLPDIPLVVLSAGRDRPEWWMELQKDLPNIVPTKGRYILAEESGHWIQNDQPELVTEAIRQVVEEARHCGRVDSRT